MVKPSGEGVASSTFRVTVVTLAHGITTMNVTSVRKAINLVVCFQFGVAFLSFSNSL